MSDFYLILVFLFLVSFAVGYWLGRARGPESKPEEFSVKYLQGLQFLLNEQPDKAVDIFIEMIEVNSDTVETHVALGSLFRRRGEVDRAIRIHQNLIARPSLSRAQRVQALFELAQDYLRAGVLDRAEALFLELLSMGEMKAASLKQLIDIYQQQRDWNHAIDMAQKLEMVHDKDYSKVIAHYFCELAEDSRTAGSFDRASRFIKRALSIDPCSLRAHLLQAEGFMHLARYKQAIVILKQATEQHPECLPEIIPAMSTCYAKLSQSTEYLAFLRNRVERCDVPVVSAILNKQAQALPPAQLKTILIKDLSQSPTIFGVKAFVDFQCQGEYGGREAWRLLQGFIDKILEKKPSYQCSNCGFSSKTLYWFCPSCKNWDTVRSLLSLEAI